MRYKSAVLKIFNTCIAANDWWPGFQIRTCLYGGCDVGTWAMCVFRPRRPLISRHAGPAISRMAVQW